ARAIGPNSPLARALSSAQTPPATLRPAEVFWAGSRCSFTVCDCRCRAVRPSGGRLYPAFGGQPLHTALFGGGQLVVLRLHFDLDILVFVEQPAVVHLERNWADHPGGRVLEIQHFDGLAARRL